MLGASVIWLAGVVREPPLPTDRTEKAATVVAVIFVHPCVLRFACTRPLRSAKGESVHLDGVDVGGQPGPRGTWSRIALGLGF